MKQISNLWSDRPASQTAFFSKLPCVTKTTQTMSYQRKVFFAVVLWMLQILSVHAEKVTYVYTDPQGTPLAEVDSSGQVIASLDYKPYGSQALGAEPNGPGYTGHIHDLGTNLIYMQARYYDSAMGRFITPDPLGYIGGNIFAFSRYAYANNNPIVNFDPSGASCETGQGNSNSHQPCADQDSSPQPPSPLPSELKNQIVATLAGVTVTATRTTSTVLPKIGNPALPRWLRMPPNPIVVFAVGLTYSGGMAACQEPSCMPGLQWSKSKESKPKNLPPGTIPIDYAKGKYGWSTGDLHKIKKSAQGEPKDWTGVSPDGHVWTGDENGEGVDHGHWEGLK